MVAVDVIRKLQKELPPVFSRQAVPDLIPGIFSTQTLSNLSSQKKGPPIIKVGRKACYERDSFLQWLETRLSGGEE
jgi:hypothetical protein